MSESDTQNGSRAVMLLEGACRVLAMCGALVLVALSVVTVVSVLGRYLFNTPITGDFEMVEVGCAIAVSTFLPYCQLKNGNVIVDFFTLRAPERIKNLLDAFGCILLTLAFAVLTWRLGLGGIDLYRYNDQTMILQIGTWWGFLVLVPCAALLTLVGALTTWRALHGRFSTHTVGEFE